MVSVDTTVTVLGAGQASQVLWWPADQGWPVHECSVVMAEGEGVDCSVVLGVGWGDQVQP